MATDFYTAGKDNLGLGNIDLVNDDIVAVLIDISLYTVNLSSDSVQSDIPSSAILAEKTLTGNTFSSGVFDADDVVFPSVEDTSQDIGALVLIKDTGANNTSLLIAYIDNAPEFPATPDGGDVTIAWSNGANRIFKI